MFLPVLLSVLVLPAVFLYVRLKWKFRSTQGVPSAEPCYPLLGNGLVFLFKTDEQLFVDIVKLLSNPAKLFKVWAGVYPFFCTSEPEMAYKILSHPSCLEKAFLYKLFKLPYGLFSGGYDVWKTQRKVINMAFNLRILHGFIPLMDDCAKRLVDGLNCIPEEEPVDIAQYLLRCALEMVCATSIGIDINQHQGAEKFSQIVGVIFNLVARRAIRPLLYWDKIYNFTKFAKLEQELRIEGYKYGDQILRDAIKHGMNKSGNINDDSQSRKPKIFIDQILAPSDNKKFEDVEIFENVLTMIAAGTDTTGTQLCYILQMLALHPDLQERAYREIVQVFPKDDILLSPETLKQLEYLDMFIKETMRLYPVAPNILREAYTDLKLDGLSIPKGTVFVISVYNIHRRKDVWGPNEDRFDPENFSPERSEGRPPTAFIPFSTGPRNCIGHRYAMIGMKVLLVRVLKKFRVHSRMRMEDMKFKFDALLRLADKMYVTLEKRDPAAADPE